MSTSATAAALVCAAALTLTAGGACGAHGGANNVSNANRVENRTMNDNSRPPDAAANASAATPGGTPSPEADSASPSKPQLDFSADIRRDGAGGFRIEYRVTNRGGKAVLLVNRGDTEYGLGAGRVYVEPQPDGTVHFTQRGYLLPPDQGPGPTAAVYPGVSELAPGRTASETLKVAAPKARQHPYARHFPPHPVPDPLRRARFCLGVVSADAPTRTTRGTRVLTSFQSIAAQELLCSDPQELN
ncbi:MAG: hypothetical protein M3416_14370 [Acidobacteriota bacterium]|nr:hypothetical protein [Acidobacteriota bacterium]